MKGTVDCQQYNDVTREASLPLYNHLADYLTLSPQKSPFVSWMS